MITVTAKPVTVLRIGSALDVFGPSLSAEARLITAKMAFIMSTAEKTPAETITPGDSLTFTGTASIHSTEDECEAIAECVPVFRINGSAERYIIKLE